MNREAEVRAVLQGIEQRSAQTRRRYLDGIREMADAADSDRGQVSCSNLALRGDRSDHSVSNGPQEILLTFIS